ncbi:MAG: AIR synthase-related protein, partial [Dermabacter sp.]|nr:AIR synthase-related protein [Dermabacter sp.]
LGGTPPGVSLGHEKALATVLIGAADHGIARASHDLSEGGLFQSLVESTTRFDTGASIDLTTVIDRDGIDAFTALVSESHARAIVAVRPDDAPALEELARSASVSAARIGTSGGDGLELAGVGTFPLAELRERRAQTLPEHLA